MASRTTERVPGHSLVAEGAKHHPDGTMVTYGYAGWPDRTGAGQAKCSCGVLSPKLRSTRARRQWHREHKAAVADRRLVYLYSAEYSVDPGQVEGSIDEACDRIYEALLDHGLEPVMSSATDEDPRITISMEVRAHTGSVAPHLAMTLIQDALERTGAHLYASRRHHEIALVDLESAPSMVTGSPASDTRR